MTRRSGHSRPFPVLLLAGLLISVAWLVAQTFDSATVEKWFDHGIYQDHQIHKVTSLDELVEDFEAQQARWLPMAPPATNFIGWTQISTPDPMLFNPSSFPNDFVKHLVPVNRDGVVMYPVWASEDPQTRERVFRNADGDVLAALPAPADYDPRWCLVDIRLDPQWGPDYAEWLAQVYDPSHLVVRYDLILQPELVKWLMATAIRAETDKARKKDDSLDGGIILMRSLEAETSISIDGIVKTTSGIRLEIGYPDDFTNRLEIFACTNLIDFQWILAATNLSTLGTNTIYWTDTSTNYPIRFLAVGNAEADNDGDGLADGREKYLYHTSPTNRDSDADGLVDGYSGIVTTNVYPGGATTNGLYVEGELTWETDPNAFDTDQDGVGDGWEVANGHDPLDPNDPPNLLGTVYYAGRQTGTIHVVAVTSSDSWATNYSGTLTETGAFHVVNLPGTSYWLKAWLDTDGSGAPNGTEATAQYTNNPITVTNQVTGRNLVLVDADSDSDGVPDWWEVEWFGSVTNWGQAGDPDADNYTNLEEYQADTDPTNSSNHPWNLAGTIAYTGAQTGLIHVAAYPSSISWLPVRIVTNATTGSYVITHLPPDTNYWVRAWRDTDGDGLPTSWEAWGQYGDNPVFLDENAAGISFTLNDPDTDGDGMPDYWELEYGLDPDTDWYTDLDGWWTLNESSGTNVADSSGNTNSGVIIGSAYGVGSIGVLSNALAFNGSNTYVQLTDAASLKPEYVSVSLWFKPDRDYTNGTAVFFSKKHPTLAQGYRLSYENGYLSFLVNATGAKTVKTLQTLTNGVWYHLAGTYGGTTQRLYVNGIQRATTNYTWGTGMGAIDQGTTAPRMGASTDTTPAYYFDGILDDVRIYGAGLDSNTVMGIAEVGADSDQDGLSNIDEFNGGTDPASADHLFEPIPYRGWDTNDSSIVTTRVVSVSFVPHWDRFYLSSSASSARGWISTGVVFEVNGTNYSIPEDNSIDITANMTTSTTFRIKHIDGSSVVGLNGWVYLLQWHGEVTLEPEAEDDGLWIAVPGVFDAPDRIYIATLDNLPPYNGGFTNRMYLSCNEVSFMGGSTIDFTAGRLTTNVTVRGTTNSPCVGGSEVCGRTLGGYLLASQAVTVFDITGFSAPVYWRLWWGGQWHEQAWGSNVTVVLMPMDAAGDVEITYDWGNWAERTVIGGEACFGGTNVLEVTGSPFDENMYITAGWTIAGATSWARTTGESWPITTPVVLELDGDYLPFRFVNAAIPTHLWLSEDSCTNVTWSIDPGKDMLVAEDKTEAWVDPGATAQVYTISVQMVEAPKFKVDKELIVVDVQYGIFNHVCMGEYHAPQHEVLTEILPPDCGAPIELTLARTTGESGAAEFVTNELSTLSISNNVTLAIQGNAPSSQEDNMSLTAKLADEPDPDISSERTFSVLEASRIEATEKHSHPTKTIYVDQTTPGTSTLYICEHYVVEGPNHTGRLDLAFDWAPESSSWDQHAHWKLGTPLGDCDVQPSVEWTTNQGVGPLAPFSVTWVSGESDPTNREYMLLFYMDCTTNGLPESFESRRKLLISVVDVKALTLGGGLTDRTRVDEPQSETNTLFICEDTNGVANFSVDVDWLPASAPGSNIYVQITGVNGSDPEVWTNWTRTMSENPAVFTNCTEFEAGREFQVVTWFDCNMNGSCDMDPVSGQDEPHRSAFVTVVNPELLTLTDPVASVSRYDTTWPDELRSASNTLFLLESPNGTAQMQIGLEWLPTTVNSNWFRWEIQQTNGTATTQWSWTNSAAFATNPVTVTWTNRVGEESNRVFVVNGWFDANGNGTMNEAEPHRQLFVTVLKLALIPDYNRDGSIDDADRARAATNEVFHFWINDDDDSGYDGGNDIQGDGSADSGNGTVDGVRDLVDFFPVFVDIKDTLAILSTNDWDFVLRHQTGALNAFACNSLPSSSDPDLKPNAFLYSTNFGNIYGTFSVGQISSSGLILPQGLLSEILVNNRGIILAEGRSVTTDSLVLEVRRKSDSALIGQTQMSLRLSGVEDMYRHINLRPSGSGGRATSMNEPANYPDSLCSSKNLFFLHGAFVNGNDARGSHAEIFKRLCWSGSTAKYWGITWEGDLGLFNALFYQEDVANAMNVVASNLFAQVNGVTGTKVIMAHSLGNMVVSTAIQDYGLSVSNYLMLNPAVATECYRPASFNDLTNGNYMLHEDWIEYSNKTWCSTWYRLFSSQDDRAELTWQDRFSSITAHNFYSTGDELFEIYAGTPGVFSGGPWHLERYAWQKQEIFKGRECLGGTSWAGWGFAGHWDDDTWVHEYTRAQANVATDALLQTNAVFLQEPTTMFSSTITTQNVNSILALGVPALSRAAGGNAISVGGFVNYNDEDNKPNGWPRSGGTYQNRWLHSDFRAMAYLYTYDLFNEIVSQGGLQ